MCFKCCPVYFIPTFLESYITSFRSSNLRNSLWISGLPIRGEGVKRERGTSSFPVRKEIRERKLVYSEGEKLKWVME